MFNLLLVIHMVCSILLIFFILLNQGKGSELSVLNQNNELLNSKDSNVLLNRIIIFLAMLFVLITFFISVFNNTLIEKKKSIIDLSKYQIYK
ncbi:MAG TPA: preprotein translocase subunit SecG [Candidatus Azoamicus sp. OHIO2]